MKSIVIGDVHGHFSNLRSLLIEKGAINENNERINRDSLKVYCSGDLVDGGFNRAGDMLILEHAEEWFDGVAVGNHEWSFLGGDDFGGCRKKDRELALGLLQLEAKGVYRPALLVENWLVVHAGLADRWSFRSEADALAAIEFNWTLAKEERDETPMLDWIGRVRAGKWGNPCGGIFWLDWEEDRNKHINQIVGHSTIPSGPVDINYIQEGTTHWNIDVGGKHGHGLGGVEIENGVATPFHWGSRFRYVTREEPREESLDEMYERLMSE